MEESYPCMNGSCMVTKQSTQELITFTINCYSICYSIMSSVDWLAWSMQHLKGMNIGIQGFAAVTKCEFCLLGLRECRCHLKVNEKMW